MHQIDGISVFMVSCLHHTCYSDSSHYKSGGASSPPSPLSSFPPGSDSQSSESKLPITYPLVLIEEELHYVRCAIIVYYHSPRQFLLDVPLHEMHYLVPIREYLLYVFIYCLVLDALVLVVSPDGVP